MRNTFFRALVLLSMLLSGCTAHLRSVIPSADLRAAATAITTRRSIRPRSWITGGLWKRILRLRGGFQLGDAVYRQQRFDEAVKLFTAAAADSASSVEKYGSELFQQGQCRVHAAEILRGAGILQTVFASESRRYGGPSIIWPTPKRCSNSSRTSKTSRIRIIKTRRIIATKAIIMIRAAIMTGSRIRGTGILTTPTRDRIGIIPTTAGIPIPGQNGDKPPLRSLRTAKDAFRRRRPSRCCRPCSSRRTIPATR